MEYNGQNYNVALYCRLSLDDGNDGDSASIRTQKMMLEQYVKDQGFRIYDYYIDDGYSGLNFERPSFKRMIKDIEKGKINMVITKDLSRLGRDYIMTGYYTEIHFPNHNVRYISLNDKIDTLYDNNDIAPFKNILNDMYAKDISRKVKTAKRLLMQKGYYMAAQPPYGYKKDPNDKNHLVIDEEAAKVVKLIFELALTNIGVVKITRELNQRKIVPPSIYKASQGDIRFIKLNEARKEKLKNYDINTWNTNTVGQILRDMVYIGDMENHKYEIKNYKTKKMTKVPKEKHIIVKNTHEAIISRSDFNHVQELIKHRQRPSRHNHPNLFKGILKCQNCGRPFNLCYNARKDGRLVWRYRCIGNTTKYGKDTEPNTIGYIEIYEIVKTKLKEIMQSIKWNDESFMNNIIESGKKNEKWNNIIDEKRKIMMRLKTIDQLILKLYEDWISGKLHNSNYQKMIENYQQEQKSLNEKLEQIDNRLTQKDNQETNVNLFKEIAKKYQDFEELNLEIIHELIDTITISHVKEKDGEKYRNITINYKFLK